MEASAAVELEATDRDIGCFATGAGRWEFEGTKEPCGRTHELKIQ